METTPITRAEHEEFRKRMEEEDKRQNKRLDNLEENAKLLSSIEKLAANMEHMAKEQEKQGKRLETLEKRDGEMWRKVVGYIITAVIGVVVGFVFTQIGM